MGAETGRGLSAGGHEEQGGVWAVSVRFGQREDKEINETV